MRSLGMEDRLITKVVRRFLEVEFEIEAQKSELDQEKEILEIAKAELKKQPKQTKMMKKHLKKIE